MKNNIVHNYTSEIVCPWCGYEYSNSEEHVATEQDNEEKIFCEKCDKEFRAQVTISVEYCTNKIVDDKNFYE
jgi:hypothetical protein